MLVPHAAIDSVGGDYDGEGEGGGEGDHEGLEVAHPDYFDEPSKCRRIYHPQEPQQGQGEEDPSENHLQRLPFHLRPLSISHDHLY
jgi:hypothetical protein